MDLSPLMINWNVVIKIKSRKKRLSFSSFSLSKWLFIVTVARACTECKYCLFLQVCRHLAKLFDNVANLKFTLNEDEQATKEAIGMYSKENEYVAFNHPCDCSGQVSLLLLFVFLLHRPTHIASFKLLICNVLALTQ